MRSEPRPQDSHPAVGPDGELMVERKRPLPDEREERSSAPRGHESVRVDRPPGFFSDPYAFSWASSLAIGWSALLDRLVFQRPPPAPAAPPRRGEKAE